MTTNQRLIALACLLAALLVPLGWLSLPLHTLDTRFWYSVPDIYAAFGNMGFAGRKTYVLIEVLDLWFIAVYTAIFLTLAKKVSAGRLLRTMAFVPGIFDVIETVGILYLLNRYPIAPVGIAEIVRLATPLKWTSGALVTISLAASAWRRRRPSS